MNSHFAKYANLPNSHFRFLMRDEIERLREENERLSAEVARLKATRAAVVKACEANKIGLAREALKLSESSEHHNIKNVNEFSV